MPSTFRCYYVTKDAAGKVSAAVTERPLSDLPSGDVLIRVAYSSLNYKDALAAQAHPGVARTTPHIPGIDAAGTIEECAAAATTPEGTPFQVGQQVVVTGYDLGSGAWGGYSEYIRVPAKWVVPLPSGLSLRETMIYGTAGFTAGLSLDALQRHGVTPDQGEIVVTGSSGGVGSVAVALLAKAGYKVAAVSGKPAADAFLKKLGAARVLPRSEAHDESKKPLLSTRWAGAVETVGGNTLSTVLRSTNRGGCVTACGLVGGMDLNMTVYPFILRGVTLRGIDSAETPMSRRLELWHHLAGDWKPPHLDALVTQTVPLDGLAEQIQQILRGETMGRVLVQVGNG